MNLWNHRFSQNTNKKISFIFWDNFINSFWNCLTFRTTKINWRGKIAALFIINSRLDSTGGSRMCRGILRINIFGHTAIMILDSEIKNHLLFSFLVFPQDYVMNIAEKWKKYLVTSQLQNKNENSSIKYFDPLCVPDLWGHWQPAPLELLITLLKILFLLFSKQEE